MANASEGRQGRCDPHLDDRRIAEPTVAGFPRREPFRQGDTVLRRRREYVIVHVDEVGRLTCYPKRRRRDDPRTVTLGIDEVRLREQGYRWPRFDQYRRRFSFSGGPTRFRVHDRAPGHAVVADGLDYWVAWRVRDLLEQGGPGQVATEVEP
jgi:hypothetical protein